MLMSNPTKFQFHKGTIRTEALKNTPITKLDFNSIKVRLERPPRQTEKRL